VLNEMLIEVEGPIKIVISRRGIARRDGDEEQ
jgi:hypothetical protein